MASASEARRWARAHFVRWLSDVVPRPLEPRHVGICIVHGLNASQPDELVARCPWPELQIARLRRHTAPGYLLYVYANGIPPSQVAFLASCPEVRLFGTPRGHPQLQNVWAIRNWLARQAAPHHRVIVHLDSDAFPVRDDWLPRYAALLRWDRPVVAVQRLENGDHHSDRSFLMHRRIDLHRHLFDFSLIGAKDAGGNISGDLEAKGLGWHTLVRSNAWNHHPVIAGLYDDRIYHHAAGSREPRLRQNQALWAGGDAWEREKREQDRRTAGNPYMR